MSTPNKGQKVLALETKRPGMMRPTDTHIATLKIVQIRILQVLESMPAMRVAGGAVLCIACFNHDMWCIIK